MAKKGDPTKFDLPKPIINKGGCNLSFAGLKTAILRIAKNIKNEKDKYDLAASFQKTMEEILYKKTKLLLKNLIILIKIKIKPLLLAGGVAANKKIKRNFNKTL